MMVGLIQLRPGESVLTAPISYACITCALDAGLVLIVTEVVGSGP